MSDLASTTPDARAAGPFSALIAIIVILVGVFSFSALAVLLAYAPDLRQGDDGGGHALSRSAVGFAGAAQALRLAGDPVVINRSPLPPERTEGLLVVTPPPGVKLSEIRALGFRGPVLVVLPKWMTVGDPSRRGWVRKAGLIPPEAIPPKSLMASLRVGRAADLTRPRLVGRAAPFAAGALPTGPVESLQTMAAPGWIPVLTDAAGAVVLARDPGSPLYVLADPDLLDTQALKDADGFDGALALLRGLRAGDGAVIFDVRLNGFGHDRSVLRLLFDPPFLAVTLCLAAAAALAGFQAFCRFGPARRGGRVIPLGKTALVDNTAALIRLAGREPRLGGRYAELTVALAARAVGAPRGLGGDALTAFLDRLGAGRRTDASLADLAAQARITSSAEALTIIAARLHRWRLQIAGPDADRPAGPAAQSSRKGRP